MITPRDFLEIFGPELNPDYDTFEKCIIGAIDALDGLVAFLDDFIFDHQDNPDLVKDLRVQRAVCVSLLATLRQWGLRPDIFRR